MKTKKNRGGGLSADFRGKRISQMKQTPKTLQSLHADSKWGLVLIRSLVSAIHVCVQHHTCVRHILAHTFLPAARLLFCWRDFFCWRHFFCWRDFSLLVRLSFAGATFFRWRDCIFAGATFFFAGATFFCWHDFFSLARLFSQALICRSLLVLWRAQTTSTYSCKQDGWLVWFRSRESK